MWCVGVYKEGFHVIPVSSQYCSLAADVYVVCVYVCGVWVYIKKGFMSYQCLVSIAPLPQMCVAFGQLFCCSLWHVAADTP